MQKDHSLENQVKQRLRLYDAKPPVVEDTEVEVEEEVEEKFPGKNGAQVMPGIVITGRYYQVRMGPR